MRTVSLGLGLTSACNLECAHCYRPRPARHLSADAVRRVCDSLTIAGVNLGTGESLLNPEFREILAFLLERDLRVSLVSNGLTLSALSDQDLRRLYEVEVSIDFPDQERFDAFRGAGAWNAATGALERCRRLGVRTTVLAVLMRANHRDLPALARLAAALGAPLRVNVYQPVRTPEFLPTPAEFWVAVEDLLAHTTMLACSEPVISAAAGLPGQGVRCGRTSLRVTPSGELLPCVYWPEPAGCIDDLACGEPWDAPAFRALHQTPAACTGCELLSVCGGGCASRRRLMGNIDGPDPYCPRGRPRLSARLGTDAERLHVGNVCTLLVRA